MDTRLVALELFLKKLNIDDSIQTVDDRKRVQKAVYLGQRSGVDLGYRFGWYLMGPYCPSLTKDYFSLADAIAMGDKEYEGKELLDTIQEKLERVSPLMNKPEDVDLDPEDWLELVASLDYLLKVSKLQVSRAKEIFEEEKPNLYIYFNQAKTALGSVGLL